MRRIGSHSLDEFPLPVVRIACERCGRYRLAGARIVWRRLSNLFLQSFHHACCRARSIPARPATLQIEYD